MNQFLLNKIENKLANLILISAISLGLVAIFTSTSYVTRFSHTDVILPWQFPLWAIIPFIATGIMIFLYIILKPWMFWPTLVGATVLTSGIFVLRFPIFDAWLAGMIVLGGIVSIINGSIPRKQLKQRDWVFLFFLFLFHLLLLSIVGFFIYDNVKAIRFTIIFMMLITILYLLAKYDFPRLNSDQITHLIAWTGLFYYSLYLIHGLVFYKFVFTRGIWAGIGGFIGAGSQTVINIVSIPAASILIFHENLRSKYLGWLLLILAIIITALASARGGLLVILLTFFGTLLTFGFQRFLKVFSLLIIIFVIVGVFLFGHSQWIIDISKDLAGSINIKKGNVSYEYFGRKVNAGTGDSGRYFLARSGIESLFNENPFQSFFGFGTYAYYPVAGSYYKNISSQYEVKEIYVNLGSLGQEPPRPPALGAMIIETGFLGILFILLCLFVIFKITLFKKGLILRRQNIIIATPLISTILWTYFGEIQHIIMFYLLIMPFGIIYNWGNNA